MRFRPSLLLVLAACCCLSAAPAADPARVAALVKHLDDARFAQRQKAEDELRGMGISVVPLLQKEMESRPPLDVYRRLEKIVVELSNLRWLSDLAEAQSETAVNGKPILVFSTNGEWDGPSCMGSNLMRSVVFADLPMVEFLKDNFVTVWHNQSPELFAVKGGQEKCTPEQAKAYPQGGGGGNVRSFFCTPDGKVLYYLEGFWGQERYRDEAKVAQKLLVKTKALAAAERDETIKKALEERSRAIADERQAIRKAHPKEFEGKFEPTEVRKREAALGLLENTIKLSLPMTGKPLQPILDKIRQDNIRNGKFR